MKRKKETDLISREEVKAKYKEQFMNSLVDKERNIDFSEYAKIPCELFNKFIDSIPSAVTEKKGEWIYSVRFSRIYPMYECSNCCGLSQSCYVKFCPNCGADMRENKE